MAFFEGIGKKLSQTGQGVVQKTKDTAEIMRLNGVISDEEKNIENFYTELGKKYFEVYHDDCASEVQDVVTKIKNSLIKIKDCTEQINKIKGVVCCSGCGKEISNDTMFCSFCGAKQEVKIEEPAEQKGKTCPACGASVSEESVFCTQCGAKIEANSDVNAEPAVQQNVANKCPNCNNEVPEGSAFCTQCGTKL